MNEEAARIHELVRLLNQYKHEYYNLNNPSVSDQEFDKLFDELKQLEEEFCMILSNSPTQTVGYEVKSKLVKVEHAVPLLSLDKTKSIEELNRWKKGQEILLMLKADGLTVKLKYRNGWLVEASTRGTGMVGEDITHNVKVFKNVPLRIDYKEDIDIVGEAIIHKNDFDVINSKLPDDDKYKTPRNLVSGSVRQLDSKICAERNVYFYAFNIITDDLGLQHYKTNQLLFLEDLGFNIVEYDQVNTGQSVSTCIGDLREYAINKNIPIDGLVAMFDDIDYGVSLGKTSHHPLHSIAFKFEDEVAETVLIDIEWSVGRTGAITPVAIFEPVILDGTEVTRASLHNISILEELELGIGDVITVMKCNMIIPQIQENLTRSNTLEIPTHCPSCESKTIFEQLNDSKVLKCNNPMCKAKILGKFVHFVSRNAMNIDGLSEATLDKFITEGFISTFEDIYKLDQHKAEIVKMDGFGLKSYNKLIEAIDKSRNVKCANLIYALGIPNIGSSSSKTIAKYFNNDFKEFIFAARGRFDFTQLNDFGDVANKSIIDWVKSMDEQEFWMELPKELTIEKIVKIQSIELKDLSGITFVITGSVNTFTNRDAFKELVESLNGKVSSGVSAKTNYLVSNESSGSSKSKKAQELGVTVITETEFNEMIGRKV